MKVVHVSTSVSGSSANSRLHNALMEQGIDSNIIVQGKSRNVKNVIYASNTRKRKIDEAIRGRLYRYLLRYKYHLSDKMPFSTGMVGLRIDKIYEVKSADIIHLHWICNFLSINSITKLGKLKKPIVWTCHDSWPFTGGCHVRYGCENFCDSCGNCQIINSKSKRDLTSYVLKKKRKLSKLNISFIAPSNWMKENIQKSSLFHNAECIVIPNAIDTQLYRPQNSEQIQEILKYKKDCNKIDILFGAGSVDIPYKGFNYLLDVLVKLKKENVDLAEKIVLHVIGADQSQEEILQQYECHYWGFIDDEHKMAMIYSLADLYLYPSIDDNLPNMVMESMACETPVVAFTTGGIPDMIDHKENGYLAKYKDSTELLEGVLWMITNNKDNILGKKCRQKVVANYNYEIVAKRHIDFYNKLLASKSDD